ncbi:MAG: sulfotransferase [Pseudomonadota bacterium]
MMDTGNDRLREGLASLGKGRYRQVHAEALEMIGVDVGDPVPYCLLGVIAADHDNHMKSLDLFERSVEIAPNNPYFQAFLGKALTSIGQQNRAKEAADKAAKNLPDDPFLADIVGVIYSRTGYHELAIPFFEKAVSLEARPANFHYNLAASLQFLGDFDEASLAYKRTLERDATAYRAWSSLVGLKRQTADDNHLDALTALFDQLHDDADATLHLGHAIAKTLEDLSEYEQSLDWLHKAKRLKLAAQADGSMVFDDYFAAAQSPIEPRKDTARPEDPIFVVGLPRTGTTLIDRILSSHSQVTSVGELNVFPGLIKEATATRSNMVMDAETLAKASEVDLAQVGALYLDATRELSRGARRFVDKMPLNFFYAGLIHQALPNARIVALRRGAMDSCLSNYRQLLTVQHSYYGYTYDLAATARFYRQFDELMSYWRENLPSERFLEVHYEDVVFQQETETRRLLEFCGLDWEDDCLRFHENKAPVSTASSVQVRQPLYSGSIGRWKRYGDKLEGLRAELGELAETG